MSIVPSADEARFSPWNRPQKRRRPLSVALFQMQQGAVSANRDVIRQLQLDAAANSAHHLALRTTAPANRRLARRWTPLAHDNRRLVFLLPRGVPRLRRTTLAEDRWARKDRRNRRKQVRQAQVQSWASGKNKLCFFHGTHSSAQCV